MNIVDINYNFMRFEFGPMSGIDRLGRLDIFGSNVQTIIDPSTFEPVYVVRSTLCDVFLFL